MSASGDERDHDVGGVSVEVLAATIVDSGRARVGVSGRELHVTQGNADVEGGHDERGAQQVGVHSAEPGAFADGAHPTMGGAPVESVTVVTDQDGAVASFSDGEIDGSYRAGHEGDHGGFVAFADDAQGAMPAVETEVFDVGRMLR